MTKPGLPVSSVTSVLLLLLVFPVAGISKTTNSPSLSPNLPLAFEPNRGQALPGVDYVARGSAYSVSLKSSEAVIALASSGENKPDALHLGLVGVQWNASATAAAQLPGRSNHIHGDRTLKRGFKTFHNLPACNTRMSIPALIWFITVTRGSTNTIFS